MYHIRESIRPSADLRNHYNEISKQCREENEAVIITVNGRIRFLYLMMNTKVCSQELNCWNCLQKQMKMLRMEEYHLFKTLLMI